MKKLNSTVLMVFGGILGVSAFIIMIIMLVALIAPGSYPYAEPYIVDTPYDEYDSAIIKLRQTYPQLQDYIVTKEGDSIPVSDSDEFTKFYLPDTKYSVSCRTKSFNNTSQTRLTLVYALDNTNNKGFKSINTKELSKEDNKKIKKEFETEVLDKLGKWEHPTNSFLRFLGIP